MLLLGLRTNCSPVMEASSRAGPSMKEIIAHALPEIDSEHYLQNVDVVHIYNNTCIIDYTNNYM